MSQTTGTFKALVVLIGCILSSSVALTQVSVLTQHNSNSRTGLNANEAILNTSNVNVASFGKLFSLAVDGYIYAQPLYVPNLNVGGKTRNVLYVATEHNSVYAFDADDPTAQPLWHVGPSTLGLAIPNSEICNLYPTCPYTDLQVEIGITSTPVINVATNTIYVVNRMEEVTGQPATNHYKIWALDLVTGALKFNSPMEITATAGGNQFDPFHQLQRPGLLLLNNTLYIAFGSMGDFGGWHGWLLAYDASTLGQLAALNITPGGNGGGLWAGGAGLVADNAYIYGITSNGNFNGTGGESSVPPQCSSCFLKLDSALNEIDYYTPSAQSLLNGDNRDLGAGGPILIPGTTLLVGGGKDGMLRVVDTTTGKMGGFNASIDGNVQNFQATNAYPNGVIMGSPAYWAGPNNDQEIYFWGPSDVIKAWKLAGSTFNLVSPQGQITSPTGLSNAAALSVSSNGTQNGTGIVWAAGPVSGDANLAPQTGVLYAFDANDLSHMLWNSQQNPCRDSFGNYAKFTPPTIANGKVYLATISDRLVVYGLNPPPSSNSNNFVQVAAAVPQSPTNSVQVSYPCTESKGDLNVVAVGWSDSTSSVSSVSDSQGNNYKLAVGPTVGQNLTQSIYYAITKAAAGNTVTVTFNHSVPFPDVRILEYAGIDNTTPLDNATGASGTTGTITASGPDTTTFANDLIFGANTVGDTTVAAGSGFTSRIITSPDGDIAEDQVVSSVGTYDATAVLHTANTPWVMQLAAFKLGSSAPGGTDFTLTSSGAQTVSAGSSATYTITVTPQNGFNSAVALACSVPANMGMSCTLAPASISPNGAPATATLTVNTTAPTQAAIVPGRKVSPLYGLWLPLPAIALAGMGLGSRSRKLGIGLVLLLALALTLLVGCGGGASSSGGGGAGSPGTPAGNYTISLTASTPGLPTHTQAATLTVQ